MLHVTLQKYISQLLLNNFFPHKQLCMSIIYLLIAKDKNSRYQVTTNLQTVRCPLEKKKNHNKTA